ncbi:MAG: NAD(P)/FAD-dependent oxidoreductase [Firmicutes bacterium]|nr:NAD(P)/FAD-dependent oxidoreductase [Bacillota bacterium]
MDQRDVVIIGAGGVGCAVARELSRYQLRITVLEKECDVAGGISGRNSAVVHAGFNNAPGSLMAKLCVEGNRGFEGLCRQLDVPYRKTGKLLVAFDEQDMEALGAILRQGEENGCEGLRLVDREELKRLAPGIEGIGGMYSPQTAVFDPFAYCIALAENALANGVDFRFGSKVVGIERGGGFLVTTAGGDRFACRLLINCAGLSSGRISQMAGGPPYRIYPCRGEYFILDRIADQLLPMPVYPAPRKGIGGLGVHLTPTSAGNILIGPSAEYISQSDDLSCTRPVMEGLFDQAKAILPALSRKHIIGSYAGIRPKLAPPEEGGYRDFVIREEEDCPGLINLIGIESPGLTASMPIARMVREIAGEALPLQEKEDFIAERTAPIRFRDLTEDAQAALIREDPEYGEIICRCQKVTKREIRNAIENPFGARSISAIKYRAWATTGRCNGGYCLTRIVDMLVKEYGMKPEEISYRSPGSELFAGEVK